MATVTIVVSDLSAKLALVEERLVVVEKHAVQVHHVCREMDAHVGNFHEKLGEWQEGIDVEIGACVKKVGQVWENMKGCERAMKRCVKNVGHDRELILSLATVCGEFKAKYRKYRGMTKLHHRHLMHLGKTGDYCRLIGGTEGAK